ncbi:MAG: fibronectin type III domain-containing protein [Armatimonadetes bacterium]|nr:fibronectin type III domain-containing protein [Armatimonadota bacterium]
MGRVVPKSIVGRIDFFAARGQEWLASAAEIGLSPELAQRVADLAQEAQQAFDLQRAQEQAARAATLALNAKVAELMRVGSGAMQTIRSHAEVVEDPGVLATASLPAKRRWSRIGPPPAPQSVSCRLMSNGSVEVTWKGRFPAGTFFEVQRALGDSVAFVPVGTIGGKRYVDGTLPFGVTSATYRVIARRGGGLQAASTPVSIRFGVLPRHELSLAA